MTSPRWVLGTVLVLGLALRLAYAGFDPSSRRFEDERYAFRNVDALLSSGTFQPVSSYYPSPVFNAPVAGLIALADRLDDDRSTPRTDEDRQRRVQRKFLLARGLQAVFGTLGILVLYLIGRRLAGPVEGLWAAIGLAFLPWHLHASGYFKPDALLVTGILLALWAELRALERPTWGRHLVVGLTIALAMSAKLTGGVVAVPFALVTLALARKEPRRLAALALAGATSAVSFALLNPYWVHYPTFLRGLQRDYAMRAMRSGLDRLDALKSVGGLILGDFAHGVAFGLTALAGLGVFVVAAWRRDGGRAHRARNALLALFPVVYTGFYVAQTAYFKPNNFLPILPVTLLAGAVAAVAGWRRVKPFLARRLPAAEILAAALLATILVAPGTLYVVRSLTPSTWDAALWRLDQSLRPSYARLVMAERLRLPSPSWEGRPRRAKSWIAIRRTDDPTSTSRERLELADATLVTSATLRRATGTPLREMFDAADPARRRRFTPHGLGLLGEELELLETPWRLAGDPITLPAEPCEAAGDDCILVTVPNELAGDEVTSLAIWARLGRADEKRLDAEIDGEPLELVKASSIGSESRLVSVRGRRLAAGDRVVLRRSAGGGRMHDVRVQLLRWRPGSE